MILQSIHRPIQSTRPSLQLCRPFPATITAQTATFLSSLSLRCMPGPNVLMNRIAPPGIKTVPNSHFPTPYFSPTETTLKRTSFFSPSVGLYGSIPNPEVSPFTLPFVVIGSMIPCPRIPSGVLSSQPIFFIIKYPGLLWSKVDLSVFVSPIALSISMRQRSPTIRGKAGPRIKVILRAIILSLKFQSQVSSLNSLCFVLEDLLTRIKFNP